MNTRHKDHKHPGNGYLFWGTVFSLLGILAFFKKMMVVSGLPVWAICFLTAGVANFLKAPRIHTLLGISDKKVPLLAKIGTFLDFASLSILIISFAIAFLNS